METQLTPSEMQVVRDNPDEILSGLRKQNKMLLGDLFQGDQYENVRAAIRNSGVYRKGKRELHVTTRPVEGTNEHEVLAIAAVSRDPGRAEDFLDTIQDYTRSFKDRVRLVDQYWNIYRAEGVINNAVNKISAILSSGGTFKVRKARKGKARKAVKILEDILYFWQMNVNVPPEDGVVTGARGLKAVTHQAVRQALIEGSWVGRTIWESTNVPGLGIKADLPIIIQSLSTRYLEPPKGLIGFGEGFYWKPPREVVRELEKPSDPEAAKILKRVVERKIISVLKKDGKYFLDPALLMHVKHRGVDIEPFGESIIEAAKKAVAYQVALDHLDTVSMQNLINRLTIVMVGSDDPASPYSKAEVANARAALMTQFFEEPGPNMTIIWTGQDVKVQDVGAHAAILDLDGRHKIAEAKTKLSIGVPDALLSGTTAQDGKAAGWAAAIGTAAELEELQNSFSQAYRTVGERIAIENGFTDLDIIYEFDRSTMVDRNEERSQTRSDYVTGILSIRSYLLMLGKDPDAEFRQKAFERGLDPDDESVTWDLVFAPPKGLQGQGPGKVPGEGREPDSETGKTTPEREPERKSPEEQR